MQSLPKRPRLDEEHPRTIQRASFWYVRNDQEPKSIRLDTLESGQRLVSYDEKSFHGNWEFTVDSSGRGTYSISFNANPAKRVRAHTFTQIGDTEVYLHVGNTAEWAVMTIYLPSSSW